MGDLIIDMDEYDPYFILGVTPDDTIEHVTKEFRRKAKVLHPDKLSNIDKKNPTKVLKRNKQFKILVDCFEYISNIKKPFIKKNYKTNESKNQNFDNVEKLDSFNSNFSKLQSPNDFGYNVERMSNINNTDFETSMHNYNKIKYKPEQIFNSKQFNSNDFNKTFEYHQQQFNSDKDDSLVIHKTSDGFSGYNSTILDGCSSVSSFNGVMIVGDNFGQNGIGYNEGNYSDYKQTFNVAKNPSKKIIVPLNFEQGVSKEKPLSKKELTKQIKLREIHINNGNGSKGDFNIQEEQFIEKQKKNIKEKVEKDKEFILQYKHLFDEKTIEDAMNSKLITSKDYQY